MPNITLNGSTGVLHRDALAVLGRKGRAPALVQVDAAAFAFGLEQQKLADQQEAQAAFNQATLAAGERTRMVRSRKVGRSARQNSRMRSA